VYEFTNPSELWERGHWWKARNIDGDIPRVYVKDRYGAAAVRHLLKESSSKILPLSRKNVEKRHALLLLTTCGLFLAFHFAVRTFRRGIIQNTQSGLWAVLASSQLLHFGLLALAYAALLAQFLLALFTDHPALQTAAVRALWNAGGDGSDVTQLRNLLGLGRGAAFGRESYDLIGLTLDVGGQDVSMTFASVGNTAVVVLIAYVCARAFAASLRSPPPPLGGVVPPASAEEIAVASRLQSQRRRQLLDVTMVLSVQLAVLLCAYSSSYFDMAVQAAAWASDGVLHLFETTVASVQETVWMCLNLDFSGLGNAVARLVSLLGFLAWFPSLISLLDLLP
jgi:hypothetical protein